MTAATGSPVTVGSVTSGPQGTVASATNAPDRAARTGSAALATDALRASASRSTRKGALNNVNAQESKIQTRSARPSEG